jgi:hypothetical protein
MLGAYVGKKSEIYACPSDPEQIPCTWDSEIILSYGINVSKFSGDNDYCFWYHVKDSNVLNPSGTIIFSDCDAGKYYNGSGSNWPVPYVDHRHNNSSFRAVFCDGHTDSVKEYTVDDWDAAQ